MPDHSGLKIRDMVHVSGQLLQLTVIEDSGNPEYITLWSDAHGCVTLPVAVLVTVCHADDCATRYPAWRSGWCRKCDFMARQHDRLSEIYSMQEES